MFLSLFSLLAAFSLSAQEPSVTEIYNEAAAAYSAKDFTGAAAKFEQVIDLGDAEQDAQLIATAKRIIPRCYLQLGVADAKQGNTEAAIAHVAKSNELAELYGDMQQVAKGKNLIGMIYQKEGGEAFNNKDYATAAAIFAKGYEADPRNTDMALNLAMSYCEMGEYQKGMVIYEDIAELTNPKYEAAVAKAREMMALYTNNEVAKLQAASDFDGIIAMADELLAKNPSSALALNVRLQAYANKKDYAKVIELAEAAAEAQTAPEDKSLMYYLLGVAYNAREMRPQAIEAFRKVTAGPAAENAKTALTELSK